MLKEPYLPSQFQAPTPVQASQLTGCTQGQTISGSPPFTHKCSVSSGCLNLCVWCGGCRQLATAQPLWDFSCLDRTARKTFLQKESSMSTTKHPLPLPEQGSTALSDHLGTALNPPERAMPQHLARHHPFGNKSPQKLVHLVAAHTGDKCFSSLGRQSWAALACWRY